MTRVSILRVRPASQQHQGLSLSGLADTARVAGLGLLIESREFRIPGTEVESAVLEKLSASTSELLAVCEVLVVDLGFSLEDGREYLYGWLLASAMRLAPSTCWAAGKHVIVLAEEVPQENSELFDFVVDPEWNARVSFASLSGEGEQHSGALADVLIRLSDEARSRLAAKATDFGTLEHAQEIFFRRRGVFQMDRGVDSGYFKFHYDAGARGSEVLATHLENYFVERDVSVVIFSSRTAAPWFFDAIHAACTSVRRLGRETAWLDEGYIDDDLNLVDTAGDTWKDETRRALLLLTRTDTTACFAMPAIDRARSLKAMHRKFGDRGGRSLNLAILVSEDISIESSEMMSCGAYSADVEIHRALNGSRRSERLQLDFFFRVEIEAIRRTNWKVLAAEELQEVDYPRESAFRTPRRRGVIAEGSLDTVDFSVPNVSLWSVYEDYGVGEEPLPVVPRRHSRRPLETRRPVMHFPLLDGLNPWDALWLAEAATRAFEDALGLDRRDFAVLLPDEPTGIAPIADAMDRKCGVAVVKIPRAVIDGAVDLPVEIHGEIDDWDGDEIVLFDESTVSGGTLIDLARLVVAVTGDAPAALGVVVDLSPAGRTSRERLAEQLGIPSQRVPKHFAFQRWSPMRQDNA